MTNYAGTMARRASRVNGGLSGQAKDWNGQSNPAAGLIGRASKSGNVWTPARPEGVAPAAV